MTALFKIIKKNFKLLIRSKSSALIIILGPLLVIFLVGIAFDNVSQFSLKIGTYSDSYSELSDSLIKNMVDAGFKVRKIPGQEECINKVKTGDVHACITFPPNLQVEQGKTKEVSFHVDYSKINLVYAIMDTLTKGVSKQSSSVSMDLTAQLLDKIDQTKKDVNNLKPKLENMKSRSQDTKSTVGEASSSTGVMSSSSNTLSSNSAELRDYFLSRAVNSQGDIDTIKARVENSNATDSQKSYMISLLNGVKNYMVNIQSKIEDPSNVYDVDWIRFDENIGTMKNQINDVSSKLNSIKSGLENNEKSIGEVESEITRIHNNLGNLQITDVDTIVNPIQTTIKPVVSEKTYLNYLFPALLVLVIMFISILLSNTLVMMEKHSPAYFRNFITPTKNITFILATYLTNLLLVSLQVIIIVSISSYFFEANLLSVLPVTIPVILLITTFFTFIGMIIGYLFTSEETSTLAAISIGSIFLLLSSVIMPLESMPTTVQKIAEYGPFVLGEKMLRKAIIFKAQFHDLVPEIYYMIGASIVLFILIWVFQHITRKHLVHHLQYLAHKRMHSSKKKKK